jgi:hypothetical protein
VHGRDLPVRRARLQERARVRVIDRRPLHYTSELALLVGAPWVRSGSGLLRFGRRLLLIQDDALWLPWLDEAGQLHATPLPADASGLRLFDDKRKKPDFEAAALVGGRALLFGSGSLPSRERIAIIGPDGSTQLIDARSFYAALRAERRFAGAELNIEGAVVLDDQLLLCNRGNADPQDPAAAFDATIEVPLAELERYLSDPERALAPSLGSVEQYWLGSVAGVRLTLTDAAARDGNVYYLAAAEASPDAIADGPVLGASLGVLGRDARFASIENERGAPLGEKLEGLAAATAQDEWLAIVDADDAGKPAELLRLHAQGL